ncbi:hypothetical protein [Mesoterricola silvestris]|uniref:Uncharacterized protein n=1 Tax=Mesoterricola silvestris TaxID=2927979 RepID=A0AA48KAM6_9BACT|nr:hypothetical protein [Mesoterricola silvestris]BDU74826.1 hypothetical protein METEAL_40000 [Mesoterricola silvestris]
MQKIVGRWAAPLAGGLLFVVVLFLLVGYRLKTAEAGIQTLMSAGVMVAPVKAFILRFSLTLLIPFYVIAGLALWGATLVAATLARRGYSRRWTPLDGFLFTLSALLWTHLLLWWQVPTTLWLIPGLKFLPFWLIFPLLAVLTLAFPVRWIRREGLGPVRGTLLAAAWLGLWSLVPLLPERLPRLLTPAKGGQDRTQVLIIGLDGLRQDVGVPATSAWTGTTYLNAYTVIPATRLLWAILWGGDPMVYTIGHAPPLKEELLGQFPLPLIDRAQEKGWKPRFYIDDGGTIGLAGRPSNFDDVLMPAPGWENFVNSNMSAGFPLFAAWENWGRAFPTTNPWAPLDAGLREALRLGAGSKLVMFHSCLAHVPIFLRREELAEIKSWWTLRPVSLEPFYARQQITAARAARYDQRGDPFTSYSLRMRSILKAWEPIWAGLDRDPRFAGATRVLFSDHGERFYHVTDTIRLSGVHGYDLDPWEARITFKVDGPGFQAPPGAAPVATTVSVLSLRDALAKAIDRNTPLDRQTLETSHPVAPLRYQTLSLDLFSESAVGLFREMDVAKLALTTGIAKNGIWFTDQDQSAEERAEQVTLAFGKGADLEVVKPLKAGGAYRYLYEGYLLKSHEVVSEEAYKAAKERAKALLTAASPLVPDSRGPASVAASRATE